MRLDIAPPAVRRLADRFLSDAKARDIQQIAEDLTIRVERLFGRIGDEAQDDGLEEVAISVNGNFNDKVAYALTDTFREIPLTEGSGFSRLLYDELLNFVHEGGRLAGGW